MPETRHPNHRTRTFLGAGLALLLLTTLLPAPAAAAHALPPLGMSMEAARDLDAAGAPPGFGSFWVGPWTASTGWHSVDNALRTGKSLGVTPVLYWYYWGDSISPHCVNNGCDGRSRAQWMSMTDTLATHIRNEMGGREVIVVLENEFNKKGISESWYAPTFDTHLTTVAGKLKAVPGVKLVVGFGAWGENDWDRFPKVIAKSDYVGFQLMRASTRDSESQYRAAPDRIQYLTNHVSTTFNKPSFLYDLALSSYPDSKWEWLQSDTLRRIFDELHSGGQTGLQGVVYRTLRDNPNMDPANYYGYAERHWGLKKAGNHGADKPSWKVWKDKATATTSGAFEPSFSNVKVDEWWTQVGVGADRGIAKVEARIDNGAWTQLTKQSWGADVYAKSQQVLSDQTVTFRVTAWDGSVATSAGYARGGVAQMSVKFNDVRVGEWWTQTRIEASAPLAKVEARVNGGAWVPLDKQNWGTDVYAKSLHVQPGESVEFRATGTGGTSVASGKFWRDAAPLKATFTNVRVSEWWVQTDVSADRTLAKVEARVDGGAWTELARTSWGAYGKSIQVPAGKSVEFRASATDGGTAMSGKHSWGNAPFIVDYRDVVLKDWWVQTGIDANRPIAKVEARVNGGAWTQLDRQNWGDDVHGKGIRTTPGQSVEFRATATDGAQSYSARYWR